MHEATRQRAEALRRRHEELERALARPDVLADRPTYQRLAKERASLSELVASWREVLRIEQELRQAGQLSEDAGAEPELRELARTEASALQARLDDILGALETRLYGTVEGADRPVVLEIRAGTGGAEAALFAADLFRMYVKFGDRAGLRLQVLDAHATEAGGYKEIICLVEGHQPFGTLRFESGVHRVQRVPATEAAGRIHTSAVTVAVLPEPEEVEVAVDPNDLEIDVFRSSGPGGQSVNTTDSAVRITHKPTGVVVTCQDERSQLKNKVKAMRVLRARLLETQQAERTAAAARARKLQVGSGDRSEKIRTYNFPGRRVTDHRIGLTLHALDAILDGDLRELIEALQHADRQRRMASDGAA